MAGEFAIYLRRFSQAIIALLPQSIEFFLVRQPNQFRAICLLAGVAILAAHNSWAQRLQPSPVGQPTTVYQVGTNAGDASLVPIPQLGGPTYSTGTGVSAGSPGFDPYATAPNAASTPPSLLGPPVSPYGSSTAPNWNVPSWNAPTTPPIAPTYPVYPNPTTPAPNGTYPGTFAPQQPPVMFPNGLNWQATGGEYLRLFQDTRIRYTWLYGDNSSNEMQTNDVELATTLNFPNFLWSNRPLHISPTFIFHFWDGPDTVLPVEVPPRAYSAYLNMRWQPMLTPTFGGDIDFNVGAFTDYDIFVNDSMRYFGTGLFVMALTPSVTLKGGINYLDRYNLKLLPAFGILWTPNPQTRFDIFFPKPKLAQFLTTMGNTDVWWYVNGEYGGGSWTVNQGVGKGRFDINDIRIGLGIEWTGHRGTRGFAEVGYVFDRELIFEVSPGSNRSLNDTVMLRAGLAF